jgi:hypothetical protein
VGRAENRFFGGSGWFSGFPQIGKFFHFLLDNILEAIILATERVFMQLRPLREPQYLTTQPIVLPLKLNSMLMGFSSRKGSFCFLY